LKAASSDPLIVSAEFEQQTDEVESDGHSKAANSSVSGAVDPLNPGSASLVSYFGNTVRQSYVEQPMSRAIDVPNTQATHGAGGGIVAVIDTGVDASHPALQNVFVPGYDFFTNTAGIPTDAADISQSTVALLDQISQPVVATYQTPFVLNQSTVALLDQSTVALLDQSTVALLDSNSLPESFGHGTMVSGLIHLVAPGAKIMPLRAFHADGSGALSDIVNAIYYATDHGARVINMSFSSTSTSPALIAAIQYATAHKVYCVAAAGNEGLPLKVYPAAIRGVIGVASIDAADRRSSFSNYGESIAKIAAPGEALITTYPGGNYAGVWGTSFSAALMSGAIAYSTSLASHTPGSLSDALESGPRLSDESIGGSRLDLYSFVQAVLNP
jgi:subtilisin family serine protease